MAPFNKLQHFKDEQRGGLAVQCWQFPHKPRACGVTAHLFDKTAKLGVLGLRGTTAAPTEITRRLAWYNHRTDLCHMCEQRRAAPG
jgi:hypothetical protein